VQLACANQRTEPEAGAPLQLVQHPFKRTSPEQLLPLYYRACLQMAQSKGWEAS
jgi:organic hydroperoxide reductase OsmC/OhrA